MNVAYIKKGAEKEPLILQKGLLIRILIVKF